MFPPWSMRAINESSRCLVVVIFPVGPMTGEFDKIVEKTFRLG